MTLNVIPLRKLISMQGQGTGFVGYHSYRFASVKDITLDTGKAGVYGMNITSYTSKDEVYGMWVQGPCGLGE